MAQMLSIDPAMFISSYLHLTSKSSALNKYLNATFACFFLAIKGKSYFL